MFRSIIRLGPKFIKTKNYIFEDRTSLKKNFAKTWCIVAATFTLGSVIIVNFAAPTPDIQFDLKYWSSPDFKQYIDSKDSIILSKELKGAIRLYYRDEEDSKFYKTMLDYRSSFTEDP